MTARLSTSTGSRLLTTIGALLVSALFLGVTGCATVPSSGPPTDYTQVADPNNQVKETAPADGLGPLDIARGFVAANARIDQDLKLTAARSYLTPDANGRWHNIASEVIILVAPPRYDTVDGSDSQVQITGTSEGYLKPDGSFVATADREYRTVLGVVKVDGQWRIYNPPESLVLFVGDFNLAFTQRQVYFLNAAGTLVIPDRRWLPNSSLYPVTMAGQLVNRLAGGPAGPLRGAVQNQLDGASLRAPITASADGVLQVDLEGLPTLSSSSARALAAQLVFTMRADAAKIRILVDGTPLDANQAIWTTGVLGSFDPDGVPGSGSPGAVGYYIDANGGLVNLSGMPVWGTAGSGALHAEAAAMSVATGDLAVVSGAAGAQTLYVGSPLTQEPMEVRLTASSFTPPSFSRAGDEVWTVLNGDTAPEVVRLLTSGSRYPVGSASLAAIRKITSLALSPDGVRVLLVADSRLYLATVTYADEPNSAAPGAGSAIGAVATLGVPVPVRPELLVRRAIWSDSQNILAAAADPSSTYRAVWRIGLDGRQRSLLTTRGIVADVDGIAAGSGLPLLISSGGRILQLKGDDSNGEWVSAKPTGEPAFGSWPVYPS